MRHCTHAIDWRSLWVLLLATLMSSPAAAGDSAKPSGVKRVQAFDLPESVYLSDETRSVLAQHHALWASAFDDSCGVVEGAPSHMAEVRACQAAAFQQTEICKRVRKRYPITITNERLGGVDTEVFTPAPGVAAKNKNRVLMAAPLVGC